jgi:hypothetical protein
MQSIPPPGEGGAVCANHSLIAAVFTCERCGSFGCESCRSTSLPAFCEPCSLRITDGGLTASALLGDSFRLLPRNPWGFGLLLGSELAGALLPPLVFNPEQLGLFTQIASGCLSAIGTAAFLSWTHAEVLQFPGRSPLSALHVGLRKFPSLAVMKLFFGVCVGVGALLLLLPGFYFAVRLSLAAPILVLAGRGPIEALDDSCSITREQWKPLAGMLASVVALWIGCSVASAAVAFVLWRVAGEGPMARGLGVLIGGVVGALNSALFYTPVLLAWMRISRSVPSAR